MELQQYQTKKLLSNGTTNTKTAKKDTSGFVVN